jgi:hypothetical protein
MFEKLYKINQAKLKPIVSPAVIDKARLSLLRKVRLHHGTQLFDGLDGNWEFEAVYVRLQTQV